MWWPRTKTEPKGLLQSELCLAESLRMMYLMNLYISLVPPPSIKNNTGLETLFTSSLRLTVARLRFIWLKICTQPRKVNRYLFHFIAFLDCVFSQSWLFSKDDVCQPLLPSSRNVPPPIKEVFGARSILQWCSPVNTSGRNKWKVSCKSGIPLSRTIPTYWNICFQMLCNVR